MKPSSVSGDNGPILGGEIIDYVNKDKKQRKSLQ